MRLYGDPTENAIVSKALDFGLNKENLYKTMERVNEIPFDSDRKLMTTIHKFGSKYRIITKGAVDVLLNRCDKIYKDGEIIALDAYEKELILNKNANLADKALIVLGISYVDKEKLPNKLTTESVEQSLVFVRISRNDRSTERRSKGGNKNL